LIDFGTVQGQAMRQKHLQFNKAQMSIWECCELLNECVDDSDPDLEEPQIQHLLQTAEAIRLDHPDDDWFHLVGLIHGHDYSFAATSAINRFDRHHRCKGGRCMSKLGAERSRSGAN